MARSLADELAAPADSGCDAFTLRSSRPCTRNVPTFDALYNQHFAYVHRAMRHLGVRPEALDDAVQDVFVVVHAKLADFDGLHPITTWLYAIVIRVARRYRKAQASALDFASDETLASPQAPDHQAELRQKLQIAEQALASLDKHKREVFVLGEIEQMSVVEIAQVLAEPVDTIYSRLRAAKVAFHKATRRAELTLRRAP